MREKRYKLVECPNGKTLNELAEAMQKGTDTIPQNLKSTTVNNGVSSTEIKMLDFFIYGLKSLLGGEEGK